MLKLKITLIFCLLLFSTVINVNGITFSKKQETLQINTEVLYEKIISVLDSNITLKIWEEQTNNGLKLPFYSISLDNGKTFIRTVQPSYELGLRYANFDPIKCLPTIKPALIAGPDTHLYIVQFYTQPLEEFKKAITALGGIIHHYIAQFAYLVEMNNIILRQVELLPYVRWVGEYHPAYRLEEFMIDNFENAEQMYPLQRYNIQVHNVELKQILAKKISEIGGIINNANAGKLLVEATLTPEQLFSVVRFDEVLFVDRWSPYEVDMNVVREIGGANYIESVAGYNGTDVRGEVFDIGFNIDHVDFQSRPLIIFGTVDNDSHGAATSGICFGDGTGKIEARGLLPAGQGIVADCDYIGLEGKSRYDHSGELIQEPYFAVFQTSSVGSSQTDQYTTASADMDAAIFDFDLLHCQSQSNLGNKQSRPQAWAKNIISCGGIYHYNTIDKSDDCWCYGASIGPASDGRIKPTFTHFYDEILTVGSPGPTDYTYTFGGTSGATPIIAGYFGLFFQMWDDGIFGNDVDANGSVFENKAHTSTARAMLINSADQYNFTGENDDKTRMHQGWGMPNVKNLYDLRDKILVIDETDILKPFGITDYKVVVESGSPQLKVTLTYSDPPGNPAVQSQHRINDISLKVISPSGIEYWGNNGLLMGVWSESGGDPDTKNTEECVFIANPESGPWTVEISADEIIQDSHIETPEIDADYALVVSPVIIGPYPPLINGSFVGDIGKDNEFTIFTTEPVNEDVYYYVDWGDGKVDDWFGPYESGKEVTVSHIWLEEGNFTIKAKSRNIFNAEGGWSEPFIITIFKPKIEIGIVTGGLFKLNAVIKNIGETEANEINWDITFHGDKIFFGGYSSGKIKNLPAGQEVTIKSSFVLGFGETKILVNAEEPFGSRDYKWINGSLFAVYIKLVS